MKKTIFLFAFFFCHAVSISAQQVTVQDDAKVGVIVTGTGNTINTTQIFGKSPEYAELKKRLDGLQAAITKKADECAQMAKDSLPQKYRDACRAELIALNAERDLVQKIETRFRDDVIRLAETFSKIELNSERLRLAKKFFDEGKISEADNVLKEKDMAATGDAALAAKARNDSVLLQTANEFALKAQLKALKIDYDSAQILFAQSRKYFETADNLWAFASLLGEQNQAHRALEYYEKALKLARSESEEAALAMNLGNFYSAVQKMPEAEKMYLRALEIYERLAKSNPAQFEPDLARAAGNLSFFYLFVDKYPESQAAAERILALDPAQNWVRTNLDHSYLLRGEWKKAKQIYKQFIANEKDPAAAKTTLLKDWDDFEAAGAIPKERMGDVEKARKWLKK
jgi:tetratricopeptide (TPR) repeat protein